MRKSMIVPMVVVAILVGGVTYLAGNSLSALRMTTIATVTRTTLGNGGTTYSITTGEYSGCIPPVQCYPATITTSIQGGQIDAVPIALAVAAAGVVIAMGIVFASKMKK